MTACPPVVLSIAGHDPTGGAGIQADIETIVYHGCHACSVITALTTQNTRNVKRVCCQEPEALIEQLRAVIQDIKVDAIKIGFLGSAEIVAALLPLLSEYNRIPLIADPVFAAGGGAQLANDELIQAIKSEIVPRALIVTPNSHEARALDSMGSNLDECAGALINLGCRFVLIKGSHEKTELIVNRLYSASGLIKKSQWPRLPHTYHGSGCTLAASIAANVALGKEIPVSVEEAQEFTWSTLEAGYPPGHGQWFPRRNTVQNES